MVSRLTRFSFALFLVLAVAAPSAGSFATTAVASGATVYVAPFPAASGSLGQDCTLPNYNSIQLAVDGSPPGDTIIVCPGTYTEQVTIYKSLILSGSGNAIIQAPPALTVDANGKYNIVEVNNGASATMSGFTVAGPGPSGCGSIDTGIAVLDGATLNLSFATVRDITDTPFGGCQNGEGIRVGTPRYSTNPSVGSAMIDNVIVYDYQKNGIVVAGSVNGVNSTAEITNTTVTGQGPTAVIANNGIEVVDDATASISTSTIRDNFYSGPTVSACGLLIIDASGVNNDNTNVYYANQKDVCVFHGKGGSYQE
jgi:hypothetical protein